MKQKKQKGTEGFDYPKSMTGKELVECGYRIDEDGFLIANTLNYDVTFRPKKWLIKQSK